MRGILNFDMNNNIQHALVKIRIRKSLEKGNIVYYNYKI